MPDTQEDPQRNKLADLLNQSKETIQQQVEYTRTELADFFSPDKLKERSQMVTRAVSGALKSVKDQAQTIKEQVQPVGDSIADTTITFITSAGHFIESQSDDFVHILDFSGKSFGEYFEAKVQDPQQVRNYKEELRRITQYNTLINDAPEVMTADDWKAYIANIVSVLEMQLRTATNSHQRIGFAKLIELSKKKQVITTSQKSYLHSFHTITTEVLQSRDTSIRNHEVVTWMGQFVIDFDRSIIRETK